MLVYLVRQREYRTVNKHVPSIGFHSLHRSVEVILVLEVVLSGHGLGEGAIDIDTW